MAELRRPGARTGGTLGQAPQQGHQITNGGRRGPGKLLDPRWASAAGSEPRHQPLPSVTPACSQVNVDEQTGRIVPLRRKLHYTVDTASLHVADQGGDGQPVADHLVEELLEVVDEEMLVGQEPLGGDLVLAPELPHGGVEVAGIRRQVAQGAVEVAKPEVGGGGVAVVDGGGQALEVLPDVAEQGALQRAGLLGGAENAYHRVVGGLPGRGEVPQLAPTPEVLESGHPVGVLGPGDRPPVLELAQL